MNALAALALAAPLLLRPSAPPLAEAASPAPSLPAPRPDDLLQDARRAARESLRTPADPFEPVDRLGGLWTTRCRLARASAALFAGDGEAARAAVADLDSSKLGLPGLREWVLLLADAPEKERGKSAASALVARLLAFAGTAPSETLRRAALAVAAHLAARPEERSAVRGALARLEPAKEQQPRATTELLLSRFRVAESTDESRALLMELLRSRPDAPERTPDLFEEKESRLLPAALRMAPPEVRLARARALLARHSDEAAALATGLPPRPEIRLAAAEILLGASRPKEALRLLENPSPLRPDTVEAARHVEALRLAAELRLFAGERAGRKRTKKSSSHAGPAPLDPRRAAAASKLSTSLNALLGAPLPDVDRRRLLAEGVRFSLRAEPGRVRERLEGLLSFEPSSTLGAEELFADAFERFRAGGDHASLLAAARSFEEQASLFREVTARRRATYWAARAREKAGEPEAARALYASLLAGTSPDVYARWAASALGVPLPRAVPPPVEEDAQGLSGSAPAPPSRELLACGFPGLAEDAAEAEGTLDPLFAAAVASERDDHRRAAGLLKTRFPALGTPEEGAVPLPVRRAFYPLARRDVLWRAAAAEELSPALLFALIRQESLFQVSIRSRAGAVGLMQVMPATGRLLKRTAHERGRPDLYDPEENVRLGARYLAQLLRLFDGDASAALAGYNAGPGRVLRWRRESPALSTDEFLESIPLAETRDYVKRVLFFEGAYAALHGVPPEPLRAASPAVPAAR